MRRIIITIAFALASAGAALAGSPALAPGNIGRSAVANAAADWIAPSAEVQRARVRAGRRAVVRPGRPIGRPGRPIARPGVVRPGRVIAVRPWRPRPHYGALVAGVALGALVTVAVVGSAPAAPASNVCWYWQDPARTQGYWDYCY